MVPLKSLARLLDKRVCVCSLTPFLSSAYLIQSIVESKHNEVEGFFFGVTNKLLLLPIHFLMLTS